MSIDPYQGSSYRITKAQWEELNKLFGDGSKIG
jgi:hypothetical protein